jgi:uncharacterized protein YebE (UPF0316 family)
MLAVSFTSTDITLEVILGGVLIALARIADVSIGVLRFAAITAGRRKAAWCFAFLEALIWVVVVATVVSGEMNMIHAVFFALGFAFGTFVGMTLEQIIGQGEQAVRIFTDQGDAMSQVFRERGYRVTQFEGKGLKGPVQMLFIHVRRKKAARIPAVARAVDEDCFIVVDDVRASSLGMDLAARPSPLRHPLRK